MITEMNFFKGVDSGGVTCALWKLGASASHQALIIDNDYVELSGTNNNTATFKKDCSGYIVYNRSGNHLSGTCTYTMLAESDANNYTVALYSFTAQSGDTIIYTSNTQEYSWGLFV